VVWHNGVIVSFDGKSTSSVEFDNKRVYPVAVSCNPTNQLAAIVTAIAQPGMGEGRLYLSNNGTLRLIFSSNEFFFSTVAWNKDGSQLFALGSSATRTFNC
jgi:WD40 repeat protein